MGFKQQFEFHLLADANFAFAGFGSQAYKFSTLPI